MEPTGNETSYLGGLTQVYSAKCSWKGIVRDLFNTTYRAGKFGSTAGNFMKFPEISVSN